MSGTESHNEGSGQNEPTGEQRRKIVVKGGGRFKELDPEQLRRPHTVVHSGGFDIKVLGDQPGGNAGGLIRNDQRPQLDERQPPRSD